VARARFASRVLAWAREHGRRDLPWQRRPTPYRVWVSEIMLQQTQVATVIPYYRRFVTRFPHVRALAAAEPDEVLALWSGLGYYARARNLHAAAQRVVDEHGGRFPRTLEALLALPGIGRSTAGAILSLALDQRHAILDGNVKRVLARHAGVDGWPGAPAVSRALWAEAEARLPGAGCGAYTQAMMDLGASVCRARDPDCGRCPVAADCAARRDARVEELPARRPRRRVPERAATFLLLRDPAGALLLERRPPAGVWGGLWCFPECADAHALAPRLAAYGLRARRAATELAPVCHTFSHFRLRITPLLLEVAEASELRWLHPDAAGSAPLAAPVARLVACVAGATTKVST
jgi:A/G-specific adenine glycosylase